MARRPVRLGLLLGYGAGPAAGRSTQKKMAGRCVGTAHLPPRPGGRRPAERRPGRRGGKKGRNGRARHPPLFYNSDRVDRRRHLGGARRAHCCAARRPPSRPTWSPTTCRLPVAASPTSSAPLLSPRTPSASLGVRPSVAENTSDAVVAPLWWGALTGVPGLLGYRAAHNTLGCDDRSPIGAVPAVGRAAALFYYAAYLLPARGTAALTALLAPVVGGSPAAARRAVRRDAKRHPSANAWRGGGWCFSLALGRTLPVENTYGSIVEDRGTLGDGPSPKQPDTPSRGRSGPKTP